MKNLLRLLALTMVIGSPAFLVSCQPTDSAPAETTEEATEEAPAAAE